MSRRYVDQLRDGDNLDDGLDHRLDDGFAVGVSEDDGATFNPLVSFQRICAPKACVRDLCAAQWTNLVEAFGKDWVNVREGEASVFEPDFAGAGYKLIARVPADQWSRLARASLDAPEAEICRPPVQQAYSPHFD